MSASVVVGDCVEAMAAMPAASVDAVVCDPPYGLEFMGKDWDRLDGIVDADAWNQGQSNAFSRSRIRHGAAASYGLAVGRNRAMQEWHEAWAREALRVLKPGGHLLAFGGTRTYHRLVCAIEDAGFEIRDTICWMYGSGFPKSLDVSKAIDKAAGAEREVVGRRTDGRYAYGFEGTANRPTGAPAGTGDAERIGGFVTDKAEITAPATPGAERWQGWGTALKPAHEPIVVARKPLAGTVAGNVLAHGTGALNVDGCRVGYEAGGSLASNPSLRESIAGGNGGHVIASEPERRFSEPHGDGRWPANVVLGHSEGCRHVGMRTVRGDGHFPAARPASGYGSAEPESNAGGLKGQDGLVERQLDGELVEAWECVPDCPVRLLDEQTGEQRSGTAVRRNVGKSGGNFPFGAADPTARDDVGYGDVGGASRFFYTAKASRAERNAGLGEFPRNVHPTVKPIDLMRWLVRLVTPAGGLVLDPFVGSGTTGCAAVLEGFEFVGVERDPEYAKLAEARIAFWREHPTGLPIEQALTAEAQRRQVRESGQLGLLGEAVAI